MVNNEIMHHGVKGMRWGVRRFQNKDGTLTNAGKKKYSNDLHKKLKKGDYRRGRGMYTDDKLIQNIAKDARYVNAHTKLKNTKYDGPTEPYDPFFDKKVVEKAVKRFEKDMERKYNPDNHQDEKALGYYIDDVATDISVQNKAKKLNSAPNWDKAYAEYNSAAKKVIDDYLGKHKDDKIKTWHGEETYKSVVDSIIFELDRQSSLGR